jgi:citrate synthase
MIGRSHPVGPVSYDRGLAGLVAGDTRIARIDGAAGRLSYRGYSIEDLAEHASFEETAFLVLRGELPNARASAAWAAELSAWRSPPPVSFDAMRSVRRRDVLSLFRSAMSVAAAASPHRDRRPADAPHAQTARILSWSASLAAAAVRFAAEQSPVAPRPDLPYAAHFLWLLLGREPGPEATRAFEVSLIVQAEHGLHAAALAALTVASAGAGLDRAVITGIGALTGALHGGANQPAFDMVVAREGPDEARHWVRERVAEKFRFPGYGHRVYKTHDPRARALLPHAKRLLDAAGRSSVWETFDAMREEIESALGPKGLYANIDAVTGLVYEPIGIPLSAFTLPFCLAIQTGWMAHCLEYTPDGPPIRPVARPAAR